MTNRVLEWVLIALAGIAPLEAAPLQQTGAPASSQASQYRAVLNRYCVTCHNEKLKTAGLMLDKADVENPPASAEVWEKVIRKLRGGAMPPPGAPRPDKATYDSLATYLETSIDRAAFANPNPARITVHRLNRTEYANAVRDLVGVDLDAETLFPVDDSGYGFDNMGAVLSVSPALLERYLSAARKIGQMAIGDPSMGPIDETFEVTDNLMQDGRMGEDLPLGSRGGAAIRYSFPADGEYLIKIRLKRDGGDGGIIRGVALKRQVDLRLDRQRLKLFTVGGEHFGKANVIGTVAIIEKGDPRQDEYERYGADQGLEVRVPVTAGPHLIGVSFLMEDASEPEGAIHGAGSGRRGGKNGEPWLGTVTIRGPYNAKGLGDTPSRRKIFVCRPASSGGSGIVKQASLNVGGDEESCAKKILSTLAHRAYRRPATAAELQELLNFYRTGRSKGGFDAGIEQALERMLVSLDFLFRIERDPANVAPGTVYRISDLDMASRLSFFLWSSIPDDELLELAEHSKLQDKAVLEKQVKRMLSDPRSNALVSNFFGQWLQLRRVPGLSPDAAEFPDFDGNLREGFQKETELFLDSMLREDHPLIDLLDANYTFVNERLARHYGIPGVYGSTFRRVTLTDDNRRGLLGQGSILSLTSYATRTSVVLRGKWLLENILGTPPPPPPPNVPALKDRSDDGRIKSVRESMEEHRANPVCASCHLRMDPLGFAMENFNAIGKWRTTEGEADTPIDASGALPDGTKFNGPSELRKLLIGKSELFSTAITEKLLTYALGRGVEYYDEPFVRKIMRDAAPNDYRWSSLILGIVESEPFQMRRSPQP